MRSSQILVLFLLGFPVAAHASSDLFSVGGSTITIRIDPTPDAFFKKAILDWIQTSARGVSAYYGYFPVPTLLLNIHVRGEDHVHGGVTYVGRRIEISLGDHTPTDDFAQDWELTHEFFHLALPLLGDDYDWMGEGFSDYLEPIARVRNGTMSVPDFWRQFVNGLPKGLPHRGDQGLDHTHTWGRTYWGGALYWFLADLEIRKRTHNRHSVQDAARAILAAGGNGRAEWELDHLLEVGDRATGTTVLKDLHDQMGGRPYDPDLPSLWKQLGIIDGDAGISFDDQAPLAALRRAITQSTHGSGSHP